VDAQVNGTPSLEGSSNCARAIFSRKGMMITKQASGLQVDLRQLQSVPLGRCEGEIVK
jgi:hypothetical protein